MSEEKIIMYDSPEAAEQVTLTGWVSKGNDGRFWYKDEHMARWAGCTHIKCECGNISERSYTKCHECRIKSAKERYLNLPFKEWDEGAFVVDWDGDKYFFNLEDLQEYMCENEMDEIDLLFCEPVYYQPIDSETVASDSHEDWEPEDELEQKIKEFNVFLSTLPAHSWMPGKIRTSYKLPEEIKKEYAQ